MKYGQLLVECDEVAKLQCVIRDLLKHSSEANASGENSATTGSSSTNLMEIYALQIQLYSKQKDNKKLRGVFNKAMKIVDGIPHPRTLALIQVYSFITIVFTISRNLIAIMPILLISFHPINSLSSLNPSHCYYSRSS